MKVVDSRDAICPEAFSNSRYYGVYMLKNKMDVPMALLRSKSCNPPHWCIAYGNSSLFFRSFSEVMEYCSAHDLELVKKN